MFVASCTADTRDNTTKPANNQAAPAKADVPAVVDAAVTILDAKCGCSIEGVGHCGNFVMIEGKYVPLVHASLGKMEFCKQKAAGAKIEVKGAMKDGKYIAEQWQLVQ